MIFGLVLLFVIIALWSLFIKGFLFKIILFISGWFGMWHYLNTYQEWSHNVINILGLSISFAILLPTILVICAMATTPVIKE